MTVTIGLTLGDPCGIGPELWVRVLCQRFAASGRFDVELRLFGDAGVLDRAARGAGLDAAWRTCSGALRIIEVTALSDEDSRPGRPCPRSGAAQVAYLEAAIAAAEAGQLDGLCTAPIHKASAHDAGLGFPGHTELLGARLLSPEAGAAVMMLAGPSLRVALATTHIALAEVASRLDVATLCDVICTTARALHDDFGQGGHRGPHLLVAGLNPHAGEEGHFGDEESRIIRPAMAAARDRLRHLPGLRLDGPLVPDALFRAAVYGPPAERPDAVVAMYHDQGLIPLKLLDFDQAVNVTLGLRLPRTSPDHGVAHDIAAAYRARPSSQEAALALCLDLSRRRRRAGPA
jgi:4-hydroxythreonine-4-phosphate dehydrogenase